MTRLELDRPDPTEHTCWLCEHNYSVKLHLCTDQDLAGEFARVHRP